MSDFLTELKRHFNESQQEFSGLKNGFKKQVCERCLTNIFQEEVLDKAVAFSSVSKPNGRNSLGFFGFKPRPDDLEVEFEGKKVLIECKKMSKDSLWEIRNSFGQTLEYLLQGKWEEGCIIIFDLRDESNDLFDDSDAGKINKWFVNKFTMNGVPLDNCKAIRRSVACIRLNEGLLSLKSYRLE